MVYLIEKLPIPVLSLGEGPHWDCETGTLKLVDIDSAKVYSYNPSTQKYAELALGPEPVSFIIPIKGHRDKYVISSKCNIKILNWDVETGKSSLEDLAKIEAGENEDRLNDGKCDPKGRLWAGTMGTFIAEKNEFLEDKGALYSYEKSKGVIQHQKPIGLSNGLTWEMNTKKFYYIDSLQYSVFGFDYDPENGTIANRKVVFDFKKNGLSAIPDGMTIDEEGKLWVACFYGGQVIKIDPLTGKLLLTIKMPAYNITSVAFGGNNLDELYVTSALFGVSEDKKSQYPESGCTFKITGLNVKGLPMDKFQL